MMRHERQSAGMRCDGDDVAWRSGGVSGICWDAFEFVMRVGLQLLTHRCFVGAFGTFGDLLAYMSLLTDTLLRDDFRSLRSWSTS